MSKMALEKQIQEHLAFLYGSETADTLFEQLQQRLADFRRQRPELARPINPAERLTEADMMLITYGDQIREPGKSPLQTLADVLETHLKGLLSSVHLLPFYPYSSDDGFSVIDYTAVDPALGNWDDIARLSQNFQLMFDLVINHISAQSRWFQGFLQGQPPYAGYFITVEPSADLRQVARPRALPLLTAVNTPSGAQHVWTTFSPDQIDLNFKNPAVLVAMIEVLLFYVTQGAAFIRLDAIGYLWKEIGTSCLHLPQTHRVVQLFRTILDAVAPQVMLITETNVPHAENIAYFGNGRNEAQLVYQFPLAPLILHTFHTGRAEVLQSWAASLEKLPETATFFNFIASHDGIGLRPAEGLLSRAEVQNLGDQTLAHGGQVSYKNNPDGSQSAYELNITLFDALSDPYGDEPEAMRINRFMAAQAIMVALAGIPGIYIHSLVGSANDHTGMAQTGRARTINRQKWDRFELETALGRPSTRTYQVFQRYANLLRIRASQRAFHPNGEQRILTGNPALFALIRISPDGQERVLCLHNISAQPQQVKLDVAEFSAGDRWRDVFSGQIVTIARQVLQVSLEPYEVKWLVG